jgi:fatty-acyl-CoA synthase
VAIRLASPAPGAYAYPLLIKQLLHTPLATASTQEIVYRDSVRYTYREFRIRLGRLGSALTKLGVGLGTTVDLRRVREHGCDGRGGLRLPGF